MEEVEFLIPQVPNKKRKVKSDEMLKKRKKPTFHLDITKDLGKEIQDFINSEWKDCMKHESSGKNSLKWIPTIANERRKVGRGMLEKAFLKSEIIAKDESLARNASMIVWAIEQTVYDRWFIFSYDTYAWRMRSLATFIGLSPERFLTIDPSYTATMSDEQLSDYHSPQADSDFEEFMTNNAYSGVTDIVCRKCKRQGVSTFSIQIRGGDEPATQFFKCRKCPASWREG